jgi:ankyrin repeat protein
VNIFFHRFINSIVTILSVTLLVGCDYHEDSVYLGRKEAELLGHVNSGNIREIKDFLDAGGNVNLQDEPGMTPLHHAVNSDWKESHLGLIKLLIERGANVNAIDDTHHTPLHMASNATVAGLLIDARADVNAKTQRTGETPLYAAARNAAQGASKSYDVYLSLTKLLIAKGADPNVKLKSGSMIEDNEPHRAKAGETALHAVARSYSEKHASEICELLVGSGSNVNELNVKGQTPLDEALANDRNQTAQTLRKLGAKNGNVIAIDSDNK